MTPRAVTGAEIPAEVHPREATAETINKTEKLKEKRALRKLKRLARQNLTIGSTTTDTSSLALTTAVDTTPIAADLAPAGRPARPKPVIVPLTPPAPAPVFSER